MTENTSQESSGNVDKVPLNIILMSIPTISEDLAELETPVLASGESPLTFHEDSWCQLEFLTETYLPEIQRKLSEYKAFEQDNRLPSGKFGWRKLYVRQIERRPLITAPLPVQELERVLGVKAEGGPILTTTSSVSGRVKNGFTLPLGGNVYLYGYAEEQTVPVLGAIVGDSPDHVKLSEAFVKLYHAYKLVLVDWIAQMVLMSASSPESLEVWKP